MVSPPSLFFSFGLISLVLSLSLVFSFLVASLCRPLPTHPDPPLPPRLLLLLLSSAVGKTLRLGAHPFLTLIGQQGNRLDPIFKVNGFIPQADLVQNLELVVERVRGLRRETEFEEEQREMARELKVAQEREYEESLRADQEKERRSIEEREEKERQLEEEKRQEEEKRREQEELRRSREEKASRLPSEPTGSESGVTTIGFRLLDGSRIQRKFRETDTVEVSNTLSSFLKTWFPKLISRCFRPCTTSSIPKTSG